VNLRVAKEFDYPALRKIYLESRRKSFYWADTEAMTTDNFIHNLFVHPDFFGMSVGGLLLHASVEKNE